MQTLTIRAGTLEVADGLSVALDGFQPEMNLSTVGGYEVTVAIDENPAQLASILEALQSYLTQRDEGAVIQLNGHRYTLQPG